ncbi:cytochrome C [Anaeromyxobacter paludicola]|uniref:Cytochrome c n=1 Tax=Anaeromyxobacter paludicola TaxID=2918171 RepID=A0ABN6NB31_9BACT|nr:cytochrome C [Anaeromyxobacter paludicola]BDG09225.1 cytochrome c [Anaeromyxobacter paludicola]
MRIRMQWAAAIIAAFAFGANAQTAVTGKDVTATGWFNGVATSKTGTFHAGGVAACDGCHVMHNASNGVARSTKVNPWNDAVPAFLLQGADQSSTCLICHGDTTAGGSTRPYVIVNTGPATDFANMNYSPGGDFGWLLRGGNASDVQNRHGHNIVAADFVIPADTLLTAPGGTLSFDATGQKVFSCSSCHDPHGRTRMQTDATGTTWNWAGPTAPGSDNTAITAPIYSSGSYGNLPAAGQAIGAYRLLGGKGYAPASNPASPFTYNPPVAVAPTDYNKAETGAGLDRSKEVRVAYGNGMAEWCRNCHTNIHMDNYLSGALGGTGLKHPAGNNASLKPGQFNVYNTYVSSGVFTGTGDQYTSLVPFESAKIISVTGNSGAVSDLGKLANPAANNIFTATDKSNVTCLSCHRAHASGFSSMVRWNNDDTFITNANALVDTQARGATALQAAYYGRTATDFGAFQRSLCNKCHGKD